MLLESCKVIACVGTVQPEKAKAFYAETLGLKLIDDAWWAIVFDAGGRAFTSKRPRNGLRRCHLLGW